jgi:cellulose synthase (UDP-forming)
MPLVSATLLEGLLPGGLVALAALAIMPWLSRDDAWIRAALVGVALVFLARYAVWRCVGTLPPVGMTADFVLGVAFLAVEMLAVLGSAMSLVFLSRTVSRSADADRQVPALRDADRLPRIDVLICTYNEEAAILERTIRGAVSMGYPAARVWVCDDGRRPWLQRLATDLGCGYLTRPDNNHAKAGNINSALRHLAGLPEPPEFVAILDADFVPLPNFLWRTLALFHEPHVGIVQTPQHFANPDPIQSNLDIARHWPDEQRFFFDEVMASKDAWSSAFCCGTSSVLRFSVLMEIGGFPTESVTEDYLVTVRMQERGYRTIYLNEQLSLGLAPEGLAEYVTQRSRWCLGFIQICRGPSGPWSLQNNMPLVSRLIMTETFLYWAASHAFRLVALLVPAAYLGLGIIVVDAPLEQALLYFLPSFVMQTAAIAWLSRGKVLPVMADVGQILALHEILRAVVVGLVWPHGHKFKVTAKGGDRSRRFVQWPILRVVLALLAINVAAIAYAFLIDPDRGYHDSAGISLFWAWYNIVVLVIASVVCIEQPRFRRHERFDVDGDGVLRSADGAWHVGVADISQGGARLLGPAPVALGEPVSLDLEGYRLEGRVVRSDATSFALSFSDDPATARLAFALIYSGRFTRSVEEVVPGPLYWRVLQRVFG